MALEPNGICSERGSEPTRWKHATSLNITFTWHHTIPWNKLCTTWNKLVTNQEWRSVEAFLFLAGVVVSDQARIISQIKSESLEDRDELHTMLTWQKWNIVEGPGGVNREIHDDPEENFEFWALFGLSNTQRKTVQEVKRLYLAMEAYLDGGPIIAFEAALKKHRDLRNRDMIKFNPDMWEARRVARPPRFPGAPDIMSTWRKRRM